MVSQYFSAPVIQDYFIAPISTTSWTYTMTVSSAASTVSNASVSWVVGTSWWCADACLWEIEDRGTDRDGFVALRCRWCESTIEVEEFLLHVFGGGRVPELRGEDPWTWKTVATVGSEPVPLLSCDLQPIVA